MAKKPPKPRTANHFIREWRKFRGKTQEELAAAIDATSGAISQLENGLINYTQPTLEAIAEALECPPAALLLWPPEDRRRAMQSALLAYGLVEDQFASAMILIDGLEKDAAEQRRHRLGDRSAPASSHHAKEPS